MTGRGGEGETDRYKQAILDFLAEGEGGPVRARRLARRLGISRDEYGAFRRAYKALRDSGRLVLGARGAKSLPASARRVVGRLVVHDKGFGFVSPEETALTEDLFVPPGHTGGGLTGDRVAVRPLPRRGRRRIAFEVVEILERGSKSVVGSLQRSKGFLFVLPEGNKALAAPIIVRDAPPGATSGTKVVVEIVEFPEREGDLPAGVVTEVLGRSGELEVETLAVLRAYGLPDRFGAEALDEARRAAASLDGAETSEREDLTGLTVVTIDPEDARDFDDAVSVERNEDGTTTLGVHIADVAFFVPEGSALDGEARERGTSVYFPRRVVPMLPPTLSNGVCSLQEGVRRLTRSVHITYDDAARVVDRRVAPSVIVSTKRLTYEEAQAICDGAEVDVPEEVRSLVVEMERLARAIEARRLEDGMLHLDLPEVRLVLDEAGNVKGAEPETHLYSHRVIEMLMVEANEAVASLLDDAGGPFLRRAHPEPLDEAYRGLASFVRACGHSFPKGTPARRDLQRLVDQVAGRPEGYAINLALLRSFERAYYAPGEEGHYALASECYCHFTSPIRRYPDLTVHRALDRLSRGARADTDEEALAELGDLCSARERLAEAAENELRTVLVLRHLEGRVGERFEGIVTGVADFGLFVQLPRLLVEGLVRFESLGDDYWTVDAPRGRVVGELTGETIRLGDGLAVSLASVDVPRRRLDLVAELPPTGEKKRKGKGRRGASRKETDRARGERSGRRAARRPAGSRRGRG